MVGRDDSDSDDDLNTDWIQEVETLCTTNYEYVPIPSIRLVVILPSTSPDCQGGQSLKKYEITIIDRSDFATFQIPLFSGTLIRDISLFAFDIPKQKLGVGVACSYVSIHSMDEIREKLVGLHAFPCFFDLFEILVILDTKPETLSALKSKSGGKTRKTVRFHHSCTRRQES